MISCRQSDGYPSFPIQFGKPANGSANRFLVIGKLDAPPKKRKGQRNGTCWPAQTGHLTVPSGSISPPSLPPLPSLPPGSGNGVMWLTLTAPSNVTTVPFNKIVDSMVARIQAVLAGDSQMTGY